MYSLNRFALVNLAIEELEKSGKIGKFVDYLKERQFSVTGQKINKKLRFNRKVMIQLSAKCNGKAVGNWMQWLSNKKRGNGTWWDELQKFDWDVDKDRVPALGVLVSADLDEKAVSDADAEHIALYLKNLFSEETADEILAKVDDVSEKEPSEDPETESSIEATGAETNGGSAVPDASGGGRKGQEVSNDEPQDDLLRFKPFEGWYLGVVCNQNGYINFAPSHRCSNGVFKRINAKTEFPDFGNINLGKAPDLIEGAPYLLRLDDYDKLENFIKDNAAQHTHYRVDTAQLVAEGKFVRADQNNGFLLTVYPYKSRDKSPDEKKFSRDQRTLKADDRLMVYFNTGSIPDPTASALVGEEVWLRVAEGLVGPFRLRKEESDMYSISIKQPFDSGVRVFRYRHQGGLSQGLLTVYMAKKSLKTSTARVVSADVHWAAKDKLNYKSCREYICNLQTLGFPDKVDGGACFANELEDLRGWTEAEIKEMGLPQANMTYATGDSINGPLQAALAGINIQPRTEPQPDSESFPEDESAGEMPDGGEEQYGTEQAPVEGSPIPDTGREDSSVEPSRTEVAPEAPEVALQPEAAEPETAQPVGQDEPAGTSASDLPMPQAIEELSRNIKALNDQFEATVKRFHSSLADGVTASRALERLSETSRDQELERYDERARRLSKHCEGGSLSTLEGAALVDYFVRTVQKYRPNYSRNFVISLGVLIAQNFLTIFSGDPGCGKTSTCALLGHALGLDALADSQEKASSGQPFDNRFLLISVEKGWTNRKDMFGYFNPLSGTFVSPDPRRQTFLRDLNAEAKIGFGKLPFLLLLDEANLSQIEYYCTDFISMADKRGEKAQIALGDGTLCTIPDTLRVLMTANSDQTVESFSPRLLDRAWVVTMPEFNWDSSLDADMDLESGDAELIDWTLFTRTFGSRPLTDEQNNIFNSHFADVRRFAKSAGISLSPRTFRAMRSYFSAALRFMNTVSGNYVPALDYAIAQKILPRISGNGEELRATLEQYRKYYETNNFEETARLLERIIRRGDENVGFYQFF